MKQPKQTRIDEIHLKLAELGITEQDVKDAIAWARTTDSAGDSGPQTCSPPDNIRGRPAQ